MESLCETGCCGRCERREACGGCIQNDGRPFGGSCVAARLVKAGGAALLGDAKQKLMDEINALSIEGVQVSDLYLLSGCYINLAYRLPNGQQVKLLEDKNVYWGNQIEIPGSDRCYGIAADDRFLLVCQYGCNGADPQIILYKGR